MLVRVGSIFPDKLDRPKGKDKLDGPDGLDELDGLEELPEERRWTDWSWTDRTDQTSWTGF